MSKKTNQKKAMEKNSPDLGHWTLYKGVTLPENFEEDPPLGFVYLITNKLNGMFYIGQKKILKVEKRPPLKGKVRKRKIIKQSDWRTYCGSSSDLKNDITIDGKENFTFEIVEFCESKWMMSYEELRLQMLNNVLLTNRSYNGIVNVRLSKFQSQIDLYGSASKITEPFQPRPDNQS